MFKICNFHLLRTHFAALSLVLLLLLNSSKAQLVHDGSFELPLGTAAAGDYGWTVCHGMPDVQILDGAGTGIFGINTPALHGGSYLGLLDTDYESREAIGQAISIEAGTLHYGHVGLFRATTHHNWNGTGQLQIWGGADCNDRNELLWTSGSVTNPNDWKYYPIQFAAIRNHAWLSLVVVLDPGSGEMTYLCMDDFRLDNAFLDINFVNLAAQPAANGMQVSWETTPLLDAERFEIAWSADGQSFTPIGEVQGVAGQSRFEHLHQPTSTGSHFYRITVTDLGGHTTMSEVTQAVWANDRLLLYPNPLVMRQGGDVHVNLPASLSSGISLRLIDMQGRVVAASDIAQAGLVTFVLPPHLGAGCYQLQASSKGTQLHARLIVE